jgi:hypothetical protein
MSKGEKSIIYDLNQDLNNPLPEQIHKPLESHNTAATTTTKYYTLWFVVLFFWWGTR